MHLLEDLELCRLVGPVKCVVALVPVRHDPPALEGGLLAGDRPLCKLSGWREETEEYEWCLKEKLQS